MAHIKNRSWHLASRGYFCAAVQHSLAYLRTLSERQRSIAPMAMIMLLLSYPVAANAEDPFPLAWVRQIGTSSNDEGQSVAVDSAGNAILAGTTPGDLGGPSAGSSDAFLAKYSRTGALLWTRQLGTSAIDEGRSVAADSAGNVFLGGSTYGSLGGANAGDADAFLAKYSSTGALLWSRQLGTIAFEYGNSIAVDIAGNAFLCGQTAGNLGAPNAGSVDAFLAKYSPTGMLLWTRQLGTSASDDCRSVAVDSAGNAFLAGATSGNLDGPNAGGSDAFIAKYSPSGALLWIRQLGTSDLDEGTSAAVDSAGNAFLGGWTFGSLGGPNGGETDAFLAKYSPDGALLWTRQLGTSGWDYGTSVAVDGAGNALLAGYTDGNLGGPNPGNDDAFFAKYSPDGDLLWARQLGTSSGDRAHSVAVDSTGSVLLGGSTDGSLGGPQAGNGDVFIAKYAAPRPGDITGDGVVNVNDLLAVINAWGPCPAPPANCPADIAPPPNGDGAVNVNDLLMVINNWG